MIKIKVNVILRNEDTILVLKRNEEDGGFWQTITGTVEGEENLLETIRREVKEETGIDNIRIDDIPVYFFTWRKEKNDILEPVFLAYTSKDEVLLSKEHTGYKWLSLNEAREIVKTDNNKRAITQALLRDLIL